ncbi:MAG: hypothetical protein ACI4VN_06115 [Clostridia bacterium]
MKEKLMAHKNLIIGLIFVIVVALVIVVVANVAKPSYKKQIKQFAEACQSEEKMEKYVKKYVNLRAYYAMNEAEEPEDFEKEYKNAKKKDYTDSEFIDEVVEAFSEYVIEDEEIKISDIEKLENVTDDDGLLGETLADIKGMKVAKCTMKSEDQEVDCYAYFYKGKILFIMPDLTGLLNY